VADTLLAFGVQTDERPLLEGAFAPEPVHCVDVFLHQDTVPIAAGHEIISASVNDRLDAEVLRALADGGTRMIAQRATGFNNIDLDAARRLGLTVARVSHYSPYAVAEFAWALAMAVNRRIVRASRRTREFDFRLDGLLGRDLHGATAAVVGTGKIGTAFARIAHGFGMRLLGWDIAPSPECQALGMTYAALPRVLAEADLLSLHVPLLPETHHLLGRAQLRALRAGQVESPAERLGAEPRNAPAAGACCVPATATPSAATIVAATPLNPGAERPHPVQPSS
jgi:D-lactate dehydrogenase